MLLQVKELYSNIGVPVEVDNTSQLVTLTCGTGFMAPYYQLLGLSLPPTPPHLWDRPCGPLLPSDRAPLSSLFAPVPFMMWSRPRQAYEYPLYHVI
jgi:hypothetical protein